MKMLEASQNKLHSGKKSHLGDFDVEPLGLLLNMRFEQQQLQN